MQNKPKYIQLAPCSNIKTTADFNKYESARCLHEHIEAIREKYRDEWKLTNDLLVRQRAVALYFIKKLALSIGNERDKEPAHTVGCCSLRFDECARKKYVVVLNFVGQGLMAP